MSVPARLDEAVVVARTLETWAANRHWRGTDPYDALNSPIITKALRGHPLGLRVFTQLVKRSPLNLRPLLRIPPGVSAATLGLATSVYARNGFLTEDQAQRGLDECIGGLTRLVSSGFSEPCWGYHFDVQTRVFFYPSTQPNTIATAFAALGLIDAYELAGRADALELAQGAGSFFLHHVPQTRSAHGAYFGYLPGDATPIHNASMLVCAVLARLGKATGRDEFLRAAKAGVDYTVAHQRADGSWPYGELPHLDWVDGFHTGYVLDCVLTCLDAGVGGLAAENAWRRGLRFYVDALIEPNGTPRYTPASRFPIDGQCVAQAIQTLSRAASREPELAARRWSVFSYAVSRFARGDGAFVFQRERLWVNRAAHLRWVQAPFLAALTHLIASTRSGPLGS